MKPTNVALNEAVTTTWDLVNTRPMDDGDWLQITPWGDFPHQQGLQRVTPEDGARMVAAANTLAGRLASFFRGIPVFVGHPDFDPETYPDHRRYGRINQLEARDDGLYGQVAWNDLGQKNKAEGYYIYPSPAWTTNRESKGIIRPVVLISVGMTNSPNIRSSKPWTNQAPQDPALVVDPKRLSALAGRRAADAVSTLYGG